MIASGGGFGCGIKPKPTSSDPSLTALSVKAAGKHGVALDQTDMENGYLDQCRRDRCHTSGSIPVHRENDCMKFLSLLKPHSSAIVLTEW